MTKHLHELSFTGMLMGLLSALSVALIAACVVLLGLDVQPAAAQANLDLMVPLGALFAAGFTHTWLR